MTQKNITVLPAKVELSLEERKILNRNLKFIPECNFLRNVTSFESSNDKFKKSLFLSLIFSGKQQKSSPLYFKHNYSFGNLISKFKWMDNSSLLASIVDKFNYNPPRSSLPKQRCNLTVHEEQILKNLILRKDLVFRATDKNLGIVVLDKEYYISQCLLLLDDKETYRTSSLSENLEKVKFKVYYSICTYVTSSVSKLNDRLKFLKDFLLASYQIKLFQPKSSTAEIQRKITDLKFELPRFYALPKIHKNPVSYRPIVPSFNWITSPISRALSYLLQESVASRFILGPMNYLIDQEYKTIIKDTKSLVNILESLNITDKKCLFITSDITSLYTNIPIADGLNTLKKMDISEKSFTLQLLSFVLFNNFFEFNGTLFQQVKGTAMGTSCAPNYANLYVYFYEVIFIKKFKSNILFYGRYIDDILIILRSDTDLASFKHHFTTMNPYLSFSFVCSPTSVEFLDLEIFKGKQFIVNKKLDFKVHQKAINNYLYLPFDSEHPLEMKKGFIKTELIRYIRNCNNLSDYLNIRNLFIRRLSDRGYPHSFVVDVLSQISYTSRGLYLNNLSIKTINARQSPALYFNLQYNSQNENLKSSIRALFKDWSASEEYLHDFHFNLPKFMVTWNTRPSLRKMLTTKLRDNITLKLS